METNANYVTVGGFVLIGILCLFGFFLWLAGAQFNRKYSYYQAHFKGPVAGLGTGTITRYNGIDVGRIASLDFDPSDPQKVIVLLEIRPTLKIREDSVATIDSEGLVGGSYVEISGGTSSSPLLVTLSDQRYPVIRTQQSPLTRLEQSTPELVAKLNVAVERVNDLLNDKNRRALATTMTNLERISSTIARRSPQIDETVRNADEAVANIKDATRSLGPVITEVNVVVQKFGRVADNTNALLESDGVAEIPDLITEGRELVGSLNQFSDQLNRNPSVLLFGDRRKGYRPK